MRSVLMGIGLMIVWISGFAKTRIAKDIAYIPSSSNERHLLDVYTPSSKSKSLPVLIFIHGGSWNSGNKNTYRFFGKGFAKKGVVTVIINYRLSPSATYTEMASDCAAAVKWVRDHIAEYGGDPGKIFISGHSAGGHLASLVANDLSYLKAQGLSQSIKGCILIDPFGLDMYEYLSNSYWKGDSTFKKTFTYDPVAWKNGSPLYHITKDAVPQIVWIGGKTYTSISHSATIYANALRAQQVWVEFDVIKKKRHIGMIIQFVCKSNKLYDRAVKFINENPD